MASESFYQTLPSFTRFDLVTQKTCYRPLPDDWLIGVADVVDSTVAIAEGRYKTVNMAGASVIAAVMNGLGGAPFPFVFGGDGAGFGLPGDCRATAERALAACRVWSAEEMGLALRAALVPVADIRRQALDVTVARFQPAPGVSYAMFSGGGLAWAEAEMKAGTYEVAPAAAGTRPDLTGLSCRFRPIGARNGDILSLLVAPGPAGGDETFAGLIRDILAILEREAARDGHPVAPEGPRFVWPPQGLALELRTGRGGLARQGRRLAILLEHLIPWILQAARSRLGRFDPAAYRRDVAGNTDFRKFDDGLKLTVDCAPDTTAAVKTLLERARHDGIARYGLHRQDRALMTCIVPSPFTSEHMHFVDGAAGGYARAAAMLKADAAEGRKGPDRG